MKKSSSKSTPKESNNLDKLNTLSSQMEAIALDLPLTQDKAQKFTNKALRFYSIFYNILNQKSKKKDSKILNKGSNPAILNFVSLLLNLYNQKCHDLIFIMVFLRPDLFQAYKKDGNGTEQEFEKFIFHTLIQVEQCSLMNEVSAETLANNKMVLL